MAESLPLTPEESEEFERNLRAAQDADPELPEALRERRTPDGSLVGWCPQDGSQSTFMAAPAHEVLLHGTRGGGKTDVLLMDFAQEVGKGFGAAWRGILFRETYPQLADVVAKSQKWFRRMFPGARMNSSTSGASGMAWHFDSGEVLFFRHMRTPNDYWNFHGHEYPWIGWEELTNWADDWCYTRMFSCCRSSHPGIPRKIRSTTNPYGKGHDWVKTRFKLHGDDWRRIVIQDDAAYAIRTKLPPQKFVVHPTPVDDEGKQTHPRVAIHSNLEENKILLAADPKYRQSISASAQNTAMAQAWLEGSWAIVAGGMFSDVWSDEFNNVPRFVVPASWRIDRGFDWGSARPFSVGWYAVSDGSDLRFPNGKVMATVKGDLFRVREWYGWTGRANEGLLASGKENMSTSADVARGIVERELAWGWRAADGDFCRVRRGVADSAIFKVENGNCIATDMQQPVRINGRVYRGIQWRPSDKGPGSRKVGWELMRKAIKAAQPQAGLPREQPGLFVVGEECPQWIRTVLTLPRDEKDLDDVDTDAEDHAADETRYRVRVMGRSGGSGRTIGMY